MQKSPITIFFELIRIGIGTDNKLSYTPTPDEWKEVMDLAIKQTLTGIVFSGIEKLKNEQLPPKDILLSFHQYSLKIAQRNKTLNTLAIQITKKFKEEGFESVILKGQGVATFYDNPNRRTPGDIDIWLNSDRKKIISYVKKIIPNCRPVYHHVDFLTINGISTEVHFTPTWMNCYFTNKKLQDYFRRESKQQFSNRIKIEGCDGYINVPTLAFNRIYILLHIYRHLFQEGIGLRQLLDYFYILRQGFTDEEKKETVAQLKELKMLRFAGATMYVLKKVFLLEDKFLITTPLEREGKFLLNEILVAGNFGKYSPTYQNEMHSSLMRRAITKSLHHLRYLRSYPSETLWGPIFRIWQYFFIKE